MTSAARRFVVAACVAQLACAGTLLGDITASLQIQGIALEVETISVTTAIDVPTTLQTKFGGKKNDEAEAVEGLLAVGELTGPGLDAPIQLTTAPGHRFQIPGLSVEGVYYLQNIRLMNGTQFVAPASPPSAAITVANVLQTSVRVRQLTPEELRSRGIVVDGRNFDVYEYTFSFLIDGKVVEIAFPVMIDPRTHEVIPIAREQPFGLPPVTATQPPRWTPPQVIAFDMPPEPSGEGLPGEDQIEKNPTRKRTSIPAAIVIPNSFAVLHQFKTASSQNAGIDANNGLLRQFIHGGLGYDDPIEIAIADTGSGAVHRLYPVYDEAGAGSLQAVIGANGDLVSRAMIEGGYGEETSSIAGPAIDKIEVEAEKDKNGAITSINVTVRSTEQIDAKSLATGARLGAVDVSGAVVLATTAAPSLSDPYTIRWNLSAADWTTLTTAANATAISVAVTNQLRATAWSTATTVLPPPDWVLASKPLFTSNTTPVEYRESLSALSSWLTTLNANDTRTATLYNLANLSSVAQPTLGNTAPARPDRLITVAFFHAYPFQEPANGLVFARERWLDPSTGAFLTPDPMGYRDSSNLYAGLGSDPVNNRDPRGECVDPRQCAAKLQGFSQKVGDFIEKITDPYKDERERDNDTLRNTAKILAHRMRQRGVNVTPETIVHQGADFSLTASGRVLPGEALEDQTASLVAAVMGLKLASPAISQAYATSGASAATLLVADELASNVILIKPSMIGGARRLLPAAESFDDAIIANYQRYYDDAASNVIQRFNAGRIAIPAGQSWKTVLGREIDSVARGRMRNFLAREGILEGPSQDVLINRWLRDPAGTGLYRIPDIRLVQSRTILDGTIGAKTMADDQIVDFIEFSGGYRVMIVRPRVAPGAWRR